MEKKNTLILSCSRLHAPRAHLAAPSHTRRETFRSRLDPRAESSPLPSRAEKAREREKEMASAHPPVRLISSDGFEFVVDHEAACVSNTIKHMLASEGKRERGEERERRAVNAPLFSTRTSPLFIPGGFAEAELRRVTFPEIPGAVLEKVCEYMHYKLQFAETPAKSIPDFNLPPELALELLKASNFLDI